MVPLDSAKETLRLSLSLLLSLLGCSDRRLHPCFPISGRRACSLIFCLNRLTHRWLKRPLILDFSKAATSSCREGADIHLLKTVLSSPARSQGATAATRAAGSISPVVSRCVWAGRGQELPVDAESGTCRLLPPSLRCRVLDLEAMQCQTPGTLQAAPSQCISLVPCRSTSQRHADASFSHRSVWSRAAHFNTGCCWVQLH